MGKCEGKTAVPVEDELPGTLPVTLYKRYYPVFLQMFKYGLVSVVALVVDMGSLYILTEFGGLHYLLSATIAFCGGLATNYLLSIKYVFSASKYDRKREFVLYSLIGVAALALNDLIIFALVTLGLWYMAAKVVATIVGFFFNFFCRKKLYTQ